ncbi:MAG: lipase family protein [Phascolarctobacterium sp.]|nr:lipase family protein [Phascolarctobacterium sp.]
MKLFYLLLSCVLLLTSSVARATTRAGQEYVDAYFISACAGSCLGVYSPFHSLEFDYMRSYGWDVTPYLLKSEGVEANFAMAQNYFDELDQNVYVLTVRGSASKGDFQIDLKTRKAAYEPEDAVFVNAKDNKENINNYPLVHYGFDSYTNVILKNFVFDEQGQWKGVFKKINEDPKAKLFITGHSLGGAVATLLGERMVSAGMPKDKFEVITFGAPAIGNKVFAERYGDRINLKRVTNTNDPIPGGLQTFFDNYQQFGTNIKYHLSPRISGVQHDITMYFDYSVNEAFKERDRQVALGNVQAEPYVKTTPGKPVVALWMNAAKHMSDIAYITDTKRMIQDEYKDLLPSYIVMSDKINMDDFRNYDIIQTSKDAGADYVLIVNIEGSKSQTMQYHYLAVEQVLFDKDGNMLAMENVSRKVSPSVGNIQAAEQNFFTARKTLLEKLPFLNQVKKPRLFTGH